MPKTKNYRFDLPENTKHLLIKQDKDWTLFQNLIYRLLNDEPISFKDRLFLYMLQLHMRSRHYNLTYMLHDNLMTLILNAARKQIAELWFSRKAGETQKDFVFEMNGMLKCVIRFFWTANQKRRVPRSFQITFPDDPEIENIHLGGNFNVVMNGSEVEQIKVDR